MPLAFLSTAILAASSKFTATYSPVTESAPFPITGWEPAGDGKFPVILFMQSSGVPHGVNVLGVKTFGIFPALEGGPVKHFTDCGFIFAVVEART